MRARICSSDIVHISSLVVVPARSAALIMEESREGSPLAGSRASAEASTAVEGFRGGGFRGGGGVAGNWVQMAGN